VLKNNGVCLVHNLQCPNSIAWEKYGFARYPEDRYSTCPSCQLAKNMEQKRKDAEASLLREKQIAEARAVLGLSGFDRKMPEKR
jgi:hypothetical protein